MNIESSLCSVLYSCSGDGTRWNGAPQNNYVVTEDFKEYFSIDNNILNT